MQEMAELREANRLQAEEIKKLRTPVEGVTAPAKPAEAPPIPDLDSTGPDPWIITAKDGTIYDFNKIGIFEIRKIAKTYGVKYERTFNKEKLVPLVMDAIDKEFAEVPEAAPAT